MRVFFSPIVALALVTRVHGAPSAMGLRKRPFKNTAARGRALGSTAREVYGEVLETGVLVASFELAGAQTFELIVDTGSSRTYLPCKGCASCGAHEAGRYYDYDASADFSRVECSACAGIGGKCGTSGVCRYDVHYLEGSGSEGYLVRDVVSLGGSVGNATVVFGCEERELGSIKQQSADGLFGFGRQAYALRAQLASASVIDDLFSMCVEGYEKLSGEHVGGLLTLGNFDFGADAPALVYTPMVSSAMYYQVTTTSWTLGNSVVEGSRGVPTIIDSGTSYTYVPGNMHARFLQLAEDAARESGLEKVAPPEDYPDLCFGNSGGLGWSTVSEYFPALKIEYHGSARLTLSPETYLYWHQKNASAFCVGILEHDDNRILLGQITMRNTFTEFDVARSQVGMASANCEMLREKYVEHASESPRLPSPPPPPSPSQSPLPPPSPPGSSDDNDSGVFVYLAMPVVGIIGVMGGSALMKKRDSNQWRRLEEDIGEHLDGEIELVDVP